MTGAASASTQKMPISELDSEADDRSRTRDLRLGTPKKAVRFPYLRAIECARKPVK